MTDQPDYLVPAAGRPGVDFLGRGFAWPMRVDHTGGIALSHGAPNIEQSIAVILSTAIGERVHRPDFGCAIWDQLFEPINANSLGAMVQAVRMALDRWEPRIEVEDVFTEIRDHDQGKVDILVTYRVKQTNDTRNLVFPFYTIPHDGELE